MSVINTNTASLNAQRNLSSSASALTTSLQRLSSGLRINSSKDDAAGLAISERFTSQIRGLDQAKRNANDGVSMLQTAEGTLASTGDILQRVRELAVQSANATNSAGDRKAIQAEVGQLLSEADRVAQTTEFNGLKLLDGSFGSATFQVGANAGQTIQATTANFRTNSYGNNDLGSTKLTTTAATAFTGGTLKVQGIESKDVTVVAADTAATIASKINSVTTNTGVTASAVNNTALSFSTVDTSYSLAVKSDNGTDVNVTFKTGANDAAGLASALNAFNDVSSKTGVTAKLNDTQNGLVLTNSAGNNIKITNNSTASVSVDTVATAAAASAVSVGTISLSSEKGFSVTGTAAESGFANATSTLKSVSTVDVSTVSGASDALKIIDSALANVNSQRAAFGALQSRFESAVGNAQKTSENLSASRSRILDTDFAAETAKLTRGQILQQAGTAMLAQANSLPNGVLSLLRG